MSYDIITRGLETGTETTGGLEQPSSGGGGGTIAACAAVILLYYEGQIQCGYSYMRDPYDGVIALIGAGALVLPNGVSGAQLASIVQRLINGNIQTGLPIDQAVTAILTSDPGI